MIRHAINSVVGKRPSLIALALKVAGFQAPICGWFWAPGDSELSDHYEAYSDKHIDLLPVNTCNDAQEIVKTISRIQKLDSGKNLSDKQRTRLRHQQDKALHRMTLDRLKIENENLLQRRMDGYEDVEFEIQRTLF